jgi:putative NADPH-quinone reductase
MPKRIVIIQGHPDPDERRFGYALAAAYGEGAGQAGHEIKTIKVADLDFPLLRTQQDFNSGEAPPAIHDAQTSIAWADHLVIFYPLWLGTLPALLKGFFEQVFRPGFAVGRAEPGRVWKKLLTGKSARIVVTMGMPALFYRWYYRAHGLKSFERNVLNFAGISPIRASLIGMVEGTDQADRETWLQKMHVLGTSGT